MRCLMVLAASKAAQPFRSEPVEAAVGEVLGTSAVDVATGREAIAPGAEANLLQLHQDFPNLWDAWDVDRFYRNRVTDLRDVERIAMPVVDASSTEIRRRVAAGESIDGLVTPSVARVIAERGLYRG